MKQDIIRITQALDFAARKHVDQRRDGEAEEPYINHLTEVARLLAESTAGEDANLVIAGLLHDTIEDTDAGYEELLELFGQDVADLVLEVTDDKSLEKQERKRLQIEHAAHASVRAKQLKLADKIANLNSILHSPPDWTLERKQEYFEWASKVVAGCRGTNPKLEERFDELYRLGVSRLG